MSDSTTDQAPQPSNKPAQPTASNQPNQPDSPNPAPNVEPAVPSDPAASTNSAPAAESPSPAPTAAPVAEAANTTPAEPVISDAITEIPASSPAVSEKPAKKFWSASKVVVGLVVLGLAVLAGTYWYVTTQFKTNVTADHAEHMQMSPGLHEIMHVRQKLLIGTDPNFQPMEYMDNGQLVGYDIDLGRAIAKELNVPAEFVTTDFDSIFGQNALGSQNALTKGSVDMVISSVTITEERQKAYLFSNSYLNAGQVAVTATSNTTIHAAADLKGKRITVAPGTSNETLAETLTPANDIIKVANPSDQAAAVLQGKADAMLVDLTNAKGMTADYPGLKIATDPLTNDFYGIVMAKGKDDVRQEVDQILDTLQQRGVLESLKQKWLE